MDHFASMTTGTPRYYKGVVYQPIRSFEEALGGDPKLRSAAPFAAAWWRWMPRRARSFGRRFTIADAAKPTRKNAAGTQQFGPSGAGVWSTPTIDEQLGVLYVATGDNYSDPPSATSDAILAMDLKTGELLWSKQLTENDAYQHGLRDPVPGNCPESKGPDFDFGQPPILVSLGPENQAKPSERW